MQDTGHVEVGIGQHQSGDNRPVAELPPLHCIDTAHN